MFQFQSQRYNAHALYEATRRFYSFTQDKQMPCQQYHEAFINNVEVIEYCGGAVGNEPGFIDSELVNAGVTRVTATPAELTTAKRTARDRFLECAFILGSDKTRYGKLIKDLENNFVQGTNNYPSTLQGAYSLLVHWKQDPRNIVRLIGGQHDGVNFANVGTEGPRDPRCYSCGEFGHIARTCPNRSGGGGTDATATQLLLQGIEDLPVEDSFQFAHVDGQLPKSWILLDNQSTVNIFCNKRLLRDVRTTSRRMRV